MSDRENDDQANKAADPPENTGGGTAMSMDSTDESAKAADPPENTGGGNQ